ncbi:HPr family phosphocarrier protein [Agromyces bracchium]|uniref:Phosphocarrier protein HPr n=1 Tax=Agromyces bracchium TaxID=88376 RepID=A0A6I3M5Q1_9MICO|nr:HPr family phosphocarrier protein [Agromyces bracchium]MTH68088.1 HPr family phosphocarrier protein [Agromyces bracchium]
MIGLVVVSHSPGLAEAAVELGMQMVHGEAPPVRIAAGSDGRFGTDATAVAAAIDELAGQGVPGVLVVTDLGSAVLSAGLALELRESTTEVVVGAGPFVEGITAGLVLAATGAALDEVARESAAALDAKRGSSDATAAAAPAERVVEPVVQPVDAAPGDAAPAAAPAEAVEVDDPRSADEVVVNPEGLHARPAALLVQAVGAFDAVVDVTNLTTGTGPVPARSMIGLMSLGAKQGHAVRFDGSGPDAATAVDALRRLLADGFGELPTPAAG